MMSEWHEVRGTLEKRAIKAREALAEAAERAKPHAKRAAAAGREAMDGVTDKARAVAYPEQASQVLDGHFAFQPLLRGLPDPEILSVSWRSDALLGLAAMGVISLEDQIVDVTREVLHDNFRHQLLSSQIFGADYDVIHGWMDEVPGSGLRGGGILHRLQHGHNLAAARDIYERHGLVGVLVWIQHVAQDAATPTGIPFPVGGERLAGHLVESGLVTPGQAALMLSFNVAELAASFLAGAFAFRLADLVRRLQKRREVKRLCARARDAWKVGDLDAVIANYADAKAETDGDPAIEMALGWAYAERGRPAEAFLAFRAAGERLSVQDATLNHGGLRLDLRGLAYTLALARAQEVLTMSDARGQWQRELDSMLRGAIHAFVRTARDCRDRPSVAAGGRVYEWRPRHFSAAANCYLAARLALGAPFLPSSSEGPMLGERALQHLEHARSRHPEEAERIERVAHRWRLELAPIGLTAFSAADVTSEA